MIKTLKPDKRHAKVLKALIDYMEENHIQINPSDNGEGGIVVKVDNINYYLQNSKTLPPSFDNSDFAICNERGFVYVFDENNRPLY